MSASKAELVSTTEPAGRLMLVVALVATAVPAMVEGRAMVATAAGLDTLAAAGRYLPQVAVPEARNLHRIQVDSIPVLGTAGCWRRAVAVEARWGYSMWLPFVMLAIMTTMFAVSHVS